jgi:hypothetical protein
LHREHNRSGPYRTSLAGSLSQKERPRQWDSRRGKADHGEWFEHLEISGSKLSLLVGPA